MALTKQEKEAILVQYQDWINRSQAVILVEYTGVTMKDMDNIRAKVREAGGEFHVIKNTLAKRALDAAGISLVPGYFEKSTAVGFAFKDAAAMARVLSDFDKNLEFIKVKGGFLGKQALSASEIKALANLPPLPVVRAQLLGTLLAPAGKLVRTLAEPGRQVAAVIKAYADKSAAASPA